MMEIDFSQLESLSNDQLYAAILHHAGEVMAHPDNADATAMFEGVLIEFMTVTQGLSEEQAEEFITPDIVQSLAHTLSQLTR